MTEPKNDQTTRRDFLKASTVAAVGAGLLGNLAVSSRAYASGSETIRIGLIGCGGRGGGAVEDALQTEGPIELVAMADAFRDRLDDKYEHLQRELAKTNKSQQLKVSEDRKYAGFDAYKQICNDPDIDLVILATPPGFRPIHFAEAVKAGKHVFMEKPVAVDAPGVRQVLAAVEEAKKKNLKVGVGLQRRHQPHYLEAIDKVKNGEIGDVQFLRVYWNGGGVWDPRKSREQCSGEMEYQMRNWYYYTWLCGDHIVEQHIHNIDVANWIKGATPVLARGMGGREVRTDPKYGEIFDHFAVQFEYEDGSYAFSECRHIERCWSSVTEHAHGTKGTYHLAGSGRNLGTIEQKGETTYRYEGPRGRKSNPYQIEHDDLFHAIRTGQPYNEGEYGAMSTMSAILGRMVTYSGDELTFKEALESGHNILPEQFSFDAKPPVLPKENGHYPVAVPGMTEVV